MHTEKEGVRTKQVKASWICLAYIGYPSLRSCLFLAVYARILVFQVIGAFVHANYQLEGISQ